jgi:uncharacterized protein with PIN domain
MKWNALHVRDSMNCWHCNTQLENYGSQDIKKVDDGYLIQTTLHCPNCKAEVYVYLPNNKEEK